MKEFYMLGNDKPFIVPYTRQQLACLTGMTVETVIRTVKKMESDELLIIFKGKIMY
ncbi:helix-turn-helix domain-containing protein [Epilithonimonas arachidiradicis]|uniref:HTH crp-type domain-containing protein n=1 Tax=Epilithonimonas arachidiradicis TaxID=1617282 RepID=A0ABQ1X749_9FLAO|nr:hypothetical protein GCM10007332_21430 [Epilithonimonas arachidiradicis]